MPRHKGVALGINITNPNLLSAFGVKDFGSAMQNRQAFLGRRTCGNPTQNYPSARVAT
jgi:hypothetical protein